MRAGIAFGSNLGESLDLLRKARAIVVASPLLGPPFRTSSIYLTSPVGCPPESEPFLNAVLEAELVGDPAALLRDLLACEQALGRARRDESNAPRTLDLDLLYAGDLAVSNGEMTLPHPRIATRRFVLAPLAEVCPALILPGQEKSVSELLNQLPQGDSAERLDVPW